MWVDSSVAYTARALAAMNVYMVIVHMIKYNANQCYQLQQQNLKN